MSHNYPNRYLAGYPDYDDYMKRVDNSKGVFAELVILREYDQLYQRAEKEVLTKLKAATQKLEITHWDCTVKEFTAFGK